jgi:hypothetical protein
LNDRAEENAESASRETASETSKTKSRPVLADDRAWGVDDVAYFMNISPALVRKLEVLGKLPGLPRIGRRLNFDPKIVRAFRDGTLNKR